MLGHLPHIWSGVTARAAFRARTCAAVTLVVAALGLSGCLSDIEHTNPLDPNTPGFEMEGAVEGRTTRFYPPFSPLSDAEVRLKPGPYVVESREDGSFSFDGVPVGTYSITATKNGFVSIADTVSVSLGKATTDVSLRLNGLPVVKTFSIQTVHVSRWWPPDDLYLLEITADLEDPDGIGDITDVRMEIPSHDFSRPMSETGVVGRFNLSLPADSLPGPSLHSLQGTDIIVHVRDAAGFETQSSPKTIVRVIDHTPLTEEPQDLTSVEDGRPNLVWEDAALPFAFTYRIDIVRDQANVQTVVQTITDIGSDVTSLQVETTLPSGTYFWTVSVVDTFGNRSRSKEAGFVVP